MPRSSPSFGNLSVKSNLSGEFTVVNARLVRDLKRLGLWDDVMVMDLLKHFNGSLHPIDRVPQDIKALYATAFEIEPRWLVEAARAPEVDRPGPEPEHLHGRRIGQEARRTYCSWPGCVASRPPTTCAPKAATTSRSTVNKRPAQRRVVQRSTVATRRGNPLGCCGSAQAAAPPATDVKFCAIDDPGCEACQ